MILVLNELCLQNIFIGYPWGPGGTGHPKILAAVFGWGAEPPKF